jgi:hypothetical protein
MAALRNGSKCSSRRGGTARHPAFAENLYLINRSEVPPSGGALNPNPIFEIGYSNIQKYGVIHLIRAKKTLSIFTKCFLRGITVCAIPKTQSPA